MVDVRNLRNTLSSTVGTTPAIEASAKSMMRMYDESPSLAVTEWRNVLQSCQNSQLLPLLYVANEVLQNSKRNRGNKYLEAFGPVLSGSLKMICERDLNITEKVRRTAKIWGDRRIFSTRYVGELLAGLEVYRNKGGPAGPSSSNINSNISSSISSNKKDMFQHAHVTASSSNTATNVAKQASSNTATATSKHTNDSDNESFTLEEPESYDDEHDDDDDDPFGNSGPSLLDVSNFTVNKTALERETKRRRSLRDLMHDEDDNDDESKHNLTPKNKKRKGMMDISSPNTQKRKKTMLSTSALMELVNTLASWDAQSNSIAKILSSITTSDLYTCTDEVLEVGDELIEMHANANAMIENVKKQKTNLWNVAEGKRNVEIELKRFLVWMKSGLVTDEDELKFCDDLEKKLTLLQVIHGDAKRARGVKRIKEAKERAEAEAAVREKAEKEELKRSLDTIKEQSSSMKADAGMVWNSLTKEHVYIGDITEESWRD
mmetsp:Transcript_15032/g.17485  ORF Transcript_15032/g.17485 Transcript_15032/m.17485 type:complete len:490 (+) Transcript_15032:107-1576(+)